jgi:hypothetical protein
MSVSDGGSFKCTLHEELFETTDPQVWHDHLNDGSHKENGSAPCAVCGNITVFEGKVIGKKPLCEKCKEDLNK